MRNPGQFNEIGLRASAYKCHAPLRTRVINHLPLVGILLMGLVVVIAGLWAVEVWR